MEDAPSPANEPRPCRATRGAAALAVCCLVVGIIWLVLLPAVARQPAMRSDFRRLESQKVNPSAMYYTELDMIRGVIDQNEQFRREHPTALWIP
jgi:hypothetical protein